MTTTNETTTRGQSEPAGGKSDLLTLAKSPGTASILIVVVAALGYFGVIGPEATRKAEEDRAWKESMTIQLKDINHAIARLQESVAPAVTHSEVNAWIMLLDARNRDKGIDVPPFPPRVTYSQPNPFMPSPTRQ
jgi:hypothetical protein